MRILHESMNNYRDLIHAKYRDDDTIKKDNRWCVCFLDYEKKFMCQTIGFHKPSPALQPIHLKHSNEMNTSEQEANNNAAEKVEFN